MCDCITKYDEAKARKNTIEFEVPDTATMGRLNVINIILKQLVNHECTLLQARMAIGDLISSELAMVTGRNKPNDDIANRKEAQR